MLRKDHNFGWCIVACLFTIAWTNSVVGDEDDLSLAVGLRERRLFEQAEFVCRQALNELADSKKHSHIQAALIVELIRNRTDQARFATLDQRESYWQAAKMEAKRFLAQQPRHSRKLIVQLQAALIHLDRIKLFQQEQEFDAPSDLDRNQALELSRRIRENLRLIDQEIVDQLQDARNGLTADDGMTVDELTNLHRNVQFQTAQAGFERANLYGTDSEDESLNRTSALTEVLSNLNSLQRLNRPGTDLWWQTQLALAKCHRQLRDFENAQAMLDRAGENDLKRQRRKWHGPILAEQAEWLLASGIDNQRDVALSQQVLLAIDRQPVASAQLDWLALKMVTAIKTDTATKLQRQEQLDQAQRRADLIERQHGLWWGTRAKQWVGRAFRHSGQGDELERRFSESVEQGQLAMKAKQFVEANLAFEQAAAIAKQSGDTSAWRSCQINASGALEQLGRHGLAASKLLETANEEPSHSAAASIHLRGIWNLGRDVEKSGHSRIEFSKALQTHLVHWPESKTTDQARIWLGREQLAAERFSIAASTLLEVSRYSEHRVEAIRNAADALKRSTDPSAAAVLEELVKERPRDIMLLMAQASVQTRIGLEQRPVRLDGPLVSWRRLARRLKPGTSHWFEAKYNVARLLFAAGELEQATQLLEYMSALPGGWESSSFASQLNELQRKLATGASRN